MPFSTEPRSRQRFKAAAFPHNAPSVGLVSNAGYIRLCLRRSPSTLGSVSMLDFRLVYRGHSIEIAVPEVRTFQSGSRWRTCEQRS